MSSGRGRFRHPDLNLNIKSHVFRSLTCRLPARHRFVQAHAKEEANAQPGHSGSTACVAPAPGAAQTSATKPEANAEANAEVKAEAKAEAESNGGGDDDDDWANDGGTAGDVSATAQGRALFHKMRARQSRMKCANCCNILGPVARLGIGW